MQAPLESANIIRSQIKNIQENNLTETEIQNSLAVILNVDNFFSIFCEELLQSVTGYLHPALNTFIVQRCGAEDHRKKLITVCKQYAESSGLALYLLTNYDMDIILNRAKKFELLKQAAALKNANAMEQLYLDFFQKDSSSCKDLALNAEQMWPYLRQAAKLGSIYCSIQVANVYLGKNKVIRKKTDLDRAMTALLSAVPSYDGSVEYHLFSLLQWGYSNDFHCIAPDPIKAYEYLEYAATKDPHTNEYLTQYKALKELDHKRSNQVPKDITECLLRIRNCKNKSKDEWTVVKYIKKLDTFYDLGNLLSFLVDQHFIYLPPFIFDTLNSAIIKIQKTSLYPLQNSFRESSPLIESLFYRTSLAKLGYPNPHAEYFLSCLYQIGGVATNERIGIDGSSSIVIKPDPVLAAQYLRCAAENGHVYAQMELGRSLLARRENTEAIKFLTQAADQYDHQAISSLKDYYWNLFNKDPKKYSQEGQKAIHFFSMAVECDLIDKTEFQKKMKQFEQAIKNDDHKEQKLDYSAEESEPEERVSILGYRR